MLNTLRQVGILLNKYKQVNKVTLKYKLNTTYNR